MINKLLVSGLLIGLITSCNISDKKVDINCVYKDAIIYEKYDFSKIDGTTVYDIKYKGEIIKYVTVYEIDNGYDVGDTINKPCH